MTECLVCVSDAADVVACPRCAFAACATCLRRILIDARDDAACCNPECKQTWSDAFVAASLGRSWFLGAYRASRTRILLERQKAMIPATMRFVETETRRRAIMTQIDETRRRMAELQREKRDAPISRRRDIRNELRALRVHVAVLRETYSNHNHPVRTTPTQVPAQRDDFFRCATPDCLGFVSDRAPKCVVCDATTCVTCLCTKGASETHACTAEDEATAREIKRSTQACPGCHTRIQRSFGCNQMFCVVCHVGFDYVSGDRVSGPFHNPHYTEFLMELRRRGLEAPAAQRADACAQAARVTQRMACTWPLDNRVCAAVLFAIEIVEHVERMEIPRRGPVRHPDPLRAERIKYILGDINEARFCAAITRVDFDRRVDDHYRAMFHAFVDASRAVFARMQAAASEVDANARVSEMLPELSRITSIANEAALAVGTLYKRMYFEIRAAHDRDHDHAAGAAAAPSVAWLLPKGRSATPQW